MEVTTELLQINPEMGFMKQITVVLIGLYSNLYIFYKC